MAKTKKKTKSKKAPKRKTRRTANADPRPDPAKVEAAQQELAVRSLVARYLMLPVQAVGRPSAATDATGQPLQGVANVTVQVNLNVAQSYVERRAEEQRRRNEAVGQ